MPKGVFPRKIIDPQIRFWNKVLIGEPDECWLFVAKSAWGEYKGFWNGKKFDGAHRYSLELKLGRLLRLGECALHKCDNKHCVNPSHLFVGSSADNSRDMVRKGRKECGERVYGAKLTAEKVLNMRELYDTGEYGLKDLQRMFPEGNVWAALTGVTWGHVGGPIVTKGRRPYELVRRRK